MIEHLGHPRPPPFVRLAIELEAATPLRVPRWLGSTLHGAIGAALVERDGAASPEQSAGLRRWFEPDHAPLPRWLGVGAVPALVIRPPAVVARQRHLAAGAPIHVELAALHRDPASLTTLLEALTRLDDVDFGARGQRVTLRVMASAGRSLFAGGELIDVPIRETVAETRSDAASVRLSARTPLWLRRGGERIDWPRPYDLALAALRRLAAIAFAYGEGGRAISLKTLAGQLALAVETVETAWERFHEQRYSSRQGRRHTVDGVLGGLLLADADGALATVLSRVQPFGLGKGTALRLGAFELALHPRGGAREGDGEEQG